MIIVENRLTLSRSRRSDQEFGFVLLQEVQVLVPANIRGRVVLGQLCRREVSIAFGSLSRIYQKMS